MIEERVQQAAKQAAEQAAKQKTLDYVRSLMSTMKLTEEQAMNALQIPSSEQSVYLREMQHY